MADFKLQPTNHLFSASGRFSALSDTTGKARAHVEDELGPVTEGIFGSGRIFAIALRNVDEVTDKATENIKRSGDVLAAVSRNLQTSQTRYDKTEDDHLVKVNDIFTKLESSTTGQPPLSSRGTGTTFGTSLPGDAMPTATEFEGIPEWAQLLIEMGGSLVSPSYWFGKVLEWTTGTNPVDWFVEQFAGDWKGVTKGGACLTNLSAYYTDMSNTIADDCGVLFRGWEGDAADSAQSYFRRLIEAHGEQAPALTTLGNDFTGCGRGMYFAAKGASALIGMLLDMACGAALLAAAIVVATASGVGAPAALAMAEVLLVWLEAMMGVWSTVLTIQGACVGGAYLFAGVLAGYLSTVHPVEQLEMPSEG